MTELPRFRFSDLLLLLIVLALAAGVRAGYVLATTDQGFGPAALHAQEEPTRLNVAEEVELLGKKNPSERDNLIANIEGATWFGCLAPLADTEEQTAHVAPGYPWMVALLARWVDTPEAILRWIQCGLGALTAACYYFFARRAFASALVGGLAGLLCAVNPFWIINTAELNDGVLATTLLAFALALGTRGSQEGGAFTSLLFGLALAGLSLVRAALLPFAVVGVLWFLWRCRGLRRGWLFALLAFLGFANGLAPWAVRNFQVFQQPLPIADSAFLHLWIGNNGAATGGPEDEQTLRAALPPERLQELLAEGNQATRYRMLAQDVLQSIHEDPAGTLRRRLWAGLSYVFGASFLANGGQLSAIRDKGLLPEWLDESYAGILYAALLVMVVLGLLGWRWTFGWRREARLAALAAIWIPLPYILGHAGLLWGPRLPLDGVILCYVAFALACFAPNVGSRLVQVK